MLRVATNQEFSPLLRQKKQFFQIESRRRSRSFFIWGAMASDSLGFTFRASLPVHSDSGQLTDQSFMQLRKRIRSRARHVAHKSAIQRRGTVAVEAAFILLMMVPLLLGSWEVSRLVEIQQILNNAAREGARQAASGQLSASQVQQVMTNYLQDAGLPITNVVVTVQDLTSPGTDPMSASEFDRLQTNITIPFKDVRWSASLLVTNSGTILTASSTWFSENGSAYPTNITVPAGY
jgi:Flp pilus assembly protein TadG